VIVEKGICYLQRMSFLSNLQIKVMLLFFIVAFVPLGIVAAFSIKTAEELIINMVSNQLENVADDKTALLEKWISERKSDIKVVAGSSILKSMDPEQITPYLQLVVKNYEVYTGFVVVLNDGSVVFDSFGKLVSYAQKEWFKEPMVGKLYISGISLDPERKESVFCVSAPIVGDNGDVKGVVCATVGSRTILSIILRVSLGETGECYLVDKEGTFLAHKEPRRILTENIAQSESFKNIFGGGHHRRIYTDYRGIEVLGASRKIAGTEWYLVVEQDRDEAFMSADKLERYVYVVIAFSLCGAIILSWLLSFYVVNPIRTLSEAANIIAEGNFESALVKSTRTDEIGMLYAAFGDMAKQLQAKQHSLEEKVDLTQAELEETDVRLKKTELAAARSEQFAALGRLAAGVTHEIRTPLASIKLFLESVESEIEISPEYEEDFQIAMNQIKRIEATINRFLDFARPQEPVFSTIDVTQLIEDTMLVVRPKANQQETIMSQITNNDLPKIQGDKKQLGEVLLNLMVNALEAIANRGELTVAASRSYTEVGGHPRDCVRIDISDTGPGIEAKNIGRLFNPFFTTKVSGTGLGLSIVYSTVQRHGGDFKVKSIVGEGATFTVFLTAQSSEEIKEYGKGTDS